MGSTATEIAAAVRAGEVSASTITAQHLAHIRAHEPAIRAFRRVRATEAMVEAAEIDDRRGRADLPLAGVPIAVKENTPIAGLPTWNGSSAARAPIASTDHVVVRRLRQAGAVIVATSRMPELGLWATTDDDTAITVNPWRGDRTPGGSSGGSAAAVAAGLVPVAHGNDGLGSLRIPAACCGLVGVKPGRGTVPAQFPDEDWFGLAEHGVLATTVRDAATTLSVLAGTTPSPPVEVRRLRIACCADGPVPMSRADPSLVRGLDHAADVLAAAGHDMVRTGPRYPAALALYGLVTWLAAAHRTVVEGGIDTGTLQSRTTRHAVLGSWVERLGLRDAGVPASWRAAAERWFARGFDALLTPVLAAVPPAAAAWHARSWLSNVVSGVRYAPYAAPWNVAGFPAMALPTSIMSAGLPVGVQLVGPPGSELTLLALAGQLECCSPWQRHAPSWPRHGDQGGCPTMSHIAEDSSDPD